LDVSDIFLAIIFSGEMILKILATGLAMQVNRGGGSVPDA
jgi:hypothetical protein